MIRLVALFTVCSASLCLSSSPAEARQAEDTPLSCLPAAPRARATELSTCTWTRPELRSNHRRGPRLRPGLGTPSTDSGADGAWLTTPSNQRRGQRRGATPDSGAAAQHRETSASPDAGAQGEGPPLLRAQLRRGSPGRHDGAVEPHDARPGAPPSSRLSGGAWNPLGYAYVGHPEAAASCRRRAWSPPRLAGDALRPTTSSRRPGPPISERWTAPGTPSGPQATGWPPCAPFSKTGSALGRPSRRPGAQPLSQTTAYA